MDPHFDGVIFQSHAEEVRRRIEHPHPPFRVLDVRPAAEYAAGHLPGAVSTSVESLRRGLPEGTSEGTRVLPRRA